MTVSSFIPDPHRFSDEAVVLVWRLREEAPWRRSRAGTAWAHAMVSIYDRFVEAGERNGGWVGELSERGGSMWFPADRVSSAANTAIAVHEWLDSHEVTPAFEYSAVRSAIAAGRSFFFHRNDERAGRHLDLLLGPAVERADALAEAAADGALLLDTRALAEDNSLDLLSSQAGKDNIWSAQDYLAPVAELHRDGAWPPITFHEIKWAGRAFMDRPERSEGSNSGGSPRSTERLLGTVQRWDDDQEHGFIVGQNDEWFYVDPRFTVTGRPLQSGQRVYFTPRPALVPDKHRVAGAVVSPGDFVGGSVVHVADGQAYGFVEVRDHMGTTQQLFAHANENTWPLPVGGHVEFTVGENVRGATVTAASLVEREGRTSGRPSAVAVLRALAKSPQTPDSLKSVLRVSREDLNALLYEVSTRGWVVTSQAGYTSNNQVPVLTLTGEGRQALDQDAASA
jgi:hypothetical protein